MQKVYPHITRLRHGCLEAKCIDITTTIYDHKYTMFTSIITRFDFDIERKSLIVWQYLLPWPKDYEHCNKIGRKKERYWSLQINKKDGWTSAAKEKMCEEIKA